MGKIAASVLMNLFIKGNEKCHSINDPLRMSAAPFSNVNNILSMIPKDHKNKTSQ